MLYLSNNKKKNKINWRNKLEATTPVTSEQVFSRSKRAMSSKIKWRRHLVHM